ncbi:MAG: PilW family protein [Deltaproteobacteria bacterium]|nr:PilW family protein [Deltaproteobacteria bacterium]
MKKLRHIRSDFGFTLIELLVAIAASGLVLAGLVQIFWTANRSYTHQDEMATLQQNLRVAKTYLERDIRMAGCGMGSTFFNHGTQVFPLVNTNGGAAGSDSLVITYVDYDDPCNDALPPLTPNAIASPEITVNEDLTHSATPPSPQYSFWTAGVVCAAAPFFAVYTKPFDSSTPTKTQSYVFTVSSVTGTNKLQCTGLGSPIFLPNSSIRFFSSTQLVTVTYSYTSNTLTRNAGVVADSIEDLQFAFGLDTTGDGTVGTWINNADLDDTEKTQVRQVRISILGRSSNQMPGQLPNVRPLIEDHAAGTASEKYLRELLQFEIKPRNIQG